MNPEIAELDRRIRACIEKHGVTETDMRHARRMLTLARLKVSVSDFASSTEALAAAFQIAVEPIYEELPALRELAAGGTLPETKES